MRNDSVCLNQQSPIRKEKFESCLSPTILKTERQATNECCERCNVSRKSTSTLVSVIAYRRMAHAMMAVVMIGWAGKIEDGETRRNSTCRCLRDSAQIQLIKKTAKQRPSRRLSRAGSLLIAQSNSSLSSMPAARRTRESRFRRKSLQKLNSTFSAAEVLAILEAAANLTATDALWLRRRRSSATRRLLRAPSSR